MPSFLIRMLISPGRLTLELVPQQQGITIVEGRVVGSTRSCDRHCVLRDGRDAQY